MGKIYRSDHGIGMVKIINIYTAAALSVAKRLKAYLCTICRYDNIYIIHITAE